jgi:hypothetical protein
MTRKVYDAITEALHTEYTRSDLSLAEVKLLQRLIPALGKAISRTGGNDRNGNKRFTTHRLMLAAGMHRELADPFYGQD